MNEMADTTLKNTLLIVEITYIGIKLVHSVSNFLFIGVIYDVFLSISLEIYLKIVMILSSM